MPIQAAYIKLLETAARILQSGQSAFNRPVLLIARLVDWLFRALPLNLLIGSR